LERRLHTDLDIVEIDEDREFQFFLHFHLPFSEPAHRAGTFAGGRWAGGPWQFRAARPWRRPRRARSPHQSRRSMSTRGTIALPAAIPYY
jgi:hypothetical protein